MDKPADLLKMDLAEQDAVMFACKVTLTTLDELQKILHLDEIEQLSFRNMKNLIRAKGEAASRKKQQLLHGVN